MRDRHIADRPSHSYTETETWGQKSQENQAGQIQTHTTERDWTKDTRNMEQGLQIWTCCLLSDSKRKCFDFIC